VLEGVLGYNETSLDVSSCHACGIIDCNLPARFILTTGQGAMKTDKALDKSPFMRDAVCSYHFNRCFPYYGSPVHDSGGAS